MRKMYSKNQIEQIAQTSKLQYITVNPEGLEDYGLGLSFSYDEEIDGPSITLFTESGAEGIVKIESDHFQFDSETYGNHIWVNDGGVEVISGSINLLTNNVGTEIFLATRNSNEEIMAAVSLSNDNISVGNADYYELRISNGGIKLHDEVEGIDTLQIKDGHIILDLPTSDPQVAGAVWNDNGILKISAGE